MMTRIRETIHHFASEVSEAVSLKNIRHNIWFFLLLLGVFAVVFGTYGFMLAVEHHEIEYFQEHDPPGLSDNIYMAFQLFDFKSGELVTTPPLSLEIARFLAIFVAFGTVIFFFFKIFKDEVTLFVLRHFRKDYVIICGAGFLGPLIAEYYDMLGNYVVVIEKNEHADEIERCKATGALVLIDDASQHETLARVKVHKARFLFAVTGKDAVNAAIIADCYQIIQAYKGESDLKCYAHIEDHKLYPLLRKWEAMLVGNTKFTLDFFNIYHIAGKAATREHLSMKIADNPPRILIICVGQMGESIIISAAKKWRNFLIINKIEQKTKKKLEITLMDINAPEIKNRLDIEHPSIKDYANLNPVVENIFSSSFLKAAFLTNKEGVCLYDTIFICHSDETTATSIGLHLHYELRKRYEEQYFGLPDTNIVIRTLDEFGMTYLFTSLKGEPSHWGHLTVFPVLKRSRSAAAVRSGLCMIKDGLNNGQYQSPECRLTVIDSIRNDLVISIAEFFPDICIHYYLSPLKSSEKNISLLDEEKERAQITELKSNKIRHILSILKQNGYTLTPLIHWDEIPEEIIGSLREILAREIHAHWISCFEQDKFTEIPDSDNPRKKLWLQKWENLDEQDKEVFRKEVMTYPEIFAKSYLKLTGDAREIIAVKIHESYLANIRKTKPDMPAAKEWASLPEEYRDSNRAQADNFVYLIESCGYHLRPISEIIPGQNIFSPEELEKIAILEHDRWIEEKKRKGWKWGSERNEERKIHPSMVPWAQLPESEKKKDRIAVEIIPSIMAEVGFEIVREKPSLLVGRKRSRFRQKRSNR